MKQLIIDLIYGLDSRPAWVKKDDIDVLCEDEYLDIIMFGNYHILLYPDEPVLDVAVWNCNGGYSKQYVKYVDEIMDNRDKILSIAKEWFYIVREVE